MEKCQHCGLDKAFLPRGEEFNDQGRHDSWFCRDELKRKLAAARAEELTAKRHAEGYRQLLEHVRAEMKIPRDVINKLQSQLYAAREREEGLVATLKPFAAIALSIKLRNQHGDPLYGPDPKWLPCTMLVDSQLLMDAKDSLEAIAAAHPEPEADGADRGKL